MTKKQIIVAVLVAVVIVTSTLGYSTYRGKHNLRAFSFDLSGIVDDAFYAAYKVYMSWVNDGVEGGDNNKIKSSLRKILKPYYANDLSDVRYAYTTRFDNLGMTDCKLIYFGNKEIVNKLKQGEKLTKKQFKWLGHELTHTEQCVRVGGRKKYALRWFKEVKKVVLKSIQSGNFTDIVQDIFNAQKLAKYDNNMPMEVEAEERADKVVEKAYSKQ
ncbi:MAG: hypothetical protein PHD51_03695 [Patescibacteria group bacterium]|nr:hypothetical protein [Patescibacteria group bacterium]MDD5490923.1 hypothetical protein [Patescibacteria group bacterium]